MTSDPLTPDTPTILTPEELTEIRAVIDHLGEPVDGSFDAEIMSLCDSHEALRSRLQQVEQERNTLRQQRDGLEVHRNTLREQANYWRSFAGDTSQKLSVAQRRVEELEADLAEMTGIAAGLNDVLHGRTKSLAQIDAEIGRKR